MKFTSIVILVMGDNYRGIYNNIISTINNVQFYSLVYLKHMLYIIVSLNDCKFPAVLRQVYII